MLTYVPGSDRPIRGFSHDTYAQASSDRCVTAAHRQQPSEHPQRAGWGKSAVSFPVYVRYRFRELILSTVCVEAASRRRAVGASGRSRGRTSKQTPVSHWCCSSLGQALGRVFVPAILSANWDYLHSRYQGACRHRPPLVREGCLSKPIKSTWDNAHAERGPSRALRQKFNAAISTWNCAKCVSQRAVRLGFRLNDLPDCVPKLRRTLNTYKSQSIHSRVQATISRGSAKVEKTRPGRRRRRRSGCWRGVWP